MQDSTSTLFFSGRPQLSALDAGNNPTHIYNEARTLLKQHTQLPKRTTPREVERLAKTAGGLKAQSALLRDSARQKQQIVRNGLSILQTRTSHSAAMQQAKVQYAQIMSKHGENVALNGSKYAQITAGYDGFNAQFQQAEAIVNI